MTKIERRKPEDNQKYYFVSNMLTVSENTYIMDCEVDRLRYENGNCFFTAAEAKAAAEKVKALLLSLHEPATDCSQSVTDCNQLPKLTAEVFDRPDCPEWARYAAVDAACLAYWYQYPPIADERVGAWEYSKNKRQLIDQYFNRSDWQNSLIERPKKKPDWCKVGEWVWTTTYNAYFKVDEFNGLFIDGEDLDGSSYSVTLENAVPARLRPYNAKEMKALVGKILADKDGNMNIVEGWSADIEKVRFDHLYYSAVKLLNNFTIDGKPCGVFEHRNDAGEWVE